MIHNILEKKAEPMAYLHLHIWILVALAENGMLQWSDDAISALEKNIHLALVSSLFEDVDGRSTPENGKWALKKWGHQDALAGL